jgi:hypothetical protein
MLSVPPLSSTNHSPDNPIPNRAIHSVGTNCSPEYLTDNDNDGTNHFGTSSGRRMLGADAHWLLRNSKQWQWHV